MAEPVTETAASWAKPVTLCRISDLFVTGFVFYLIIMNFLLLFLKNYSKMEESSDLCVKVGESGGNDSKERQVTAVNTFMGQYTHSIDPKGRLIMPSKFRECLGESFVVSQGLDHCLFVYTDEGWEQLAEKLKSLPLTNPNARKFTRFLLGSATVCEVDKQGRILLPAHLREFAKLDKDVVLVGVGSRVEIWDKDTWTNASVYDDMEEVPENMEGLGI